MNLRGLAFFWSLIGLCAALHGATPGTATVLTTHRVYGRDYIQLLDVMNTFGLSGKALPNKAFLLSNSADSHVRFALDSREVQVLGVKHWLSAPAAAQGGHVWVPALDVVKILDPLLRHSGLVATNSLRTVVLDPGHGGDDQGTHSRNGISEKQLTLDVAGRLGALLEKQGYRVYYTRVDDRRIPLDLRPAVARVKNADLFVSIHFNSATPATGPCGAETFCLTPSGTHSTSDRTEQLTKNDFVKFPGNRFDNDNVMLAHHIQQELVAQAGASERGVKRARFEVLKDVNCPAVLVECGFLSNPSEVRMIAQSEYRQRLAAAIATGITGYRLSAKR